MPDTRQLKGVVESVAGAFLMKATLAVLVLLAVVAAFYAAWMNRASEKIVTAVVPIAVAAICVKVQPLWDLTLLAAC